jgi:hypothetical protein
LPTVLTQEEADRICPADVWDVSACGEVAVWQ